MITRSIKKSVFCTGICVLCMVSVFSQDIYQDFLHFQVNLYNAENGQQTQPMIADYKKKIETADLTEEERLTLNTLLVLEQAVFEKDEAGNGSAKAHYALFTAQNEECRKFMENKRLSSVNPHLLTGWADVKSRLTAFLSGKDMYTEANAARNLYLEALKKDKKFVQGYISYGLWLYFAPPIAGGGLEPALKQLSKAVSYAKTPEEQYLALIYRSQIYVALEQKKAAAKDLQAAGRLLSDERFTHVVIEGNKNGKLFFE